PPRPANSKPGPPLRLLFLSENGSVFAGGPTEKEGAMKEQTVGMVGLGIMGSAMSANLARAGFRVAGFDVAPRRRTEHARSGGVAARSRREVARRSSIIISSLPSARALAEVAGELAASAKRGTIMIETSTLPIAVKRNARDVLAKRGVIVLDCPLSGTGAQARVKDLLIYVSGDRAAYRKTVPVLQGFTSANYYVGPFGNGTKMKFVANLLVAIHNVATAEAFVLGMKAGLDPKQIFALISAGAGNSRVFELRGPMMAENRYGGDRVTMRVKTWQKDMAVIGDFARDLGCPTPLFNATGPIYAAAMANGHEAEDT